MSAENPGTEKIQWDTRCLHKYSLADIQEAIGKALQSLTGTPYTVEIRTLDRYPKNVLNSTFHDIVDMHVRVKKADEGTSLF